MRTKATGLLLVILLYPLVSLAEPLEGVSLARLVASNFWDNISSADAEISTHGRGRLLKFPLKITKVSGSDRDEIDYVISNQIFSIEHVFGKPNQYFQGTTPALLSPITYEEAAKQNLAGSDFSETDLGLAFLQWPQQVLVRTEKKRTRMCYVLESHPASDPLYSKVTAWIDKESLGLVWVQVFAHDGSVLKNFYPKSFQQVKGEWMLQEMEISNEHNNSRSFIIFKLR